MYVETFSERLKEARKDTGFTQTEVANELKIPRVNITNYETGRTQPDIETLGRLIDFYRADANWIIGTGKRK